jgi:hypothetical protein
MPSHALSEIEALVEASSFDFVQDACIALITYASEEMKSREGFDLTL